MARHDVSALVPALVRANAPLWQRCYQMGQILSTLQTCSHTPRKQVLHAKWTEEVLMAIDITEESLRALQAYEGRRVRLINFAPCTCGNPLHDDQLRVPSGTEGTVLLVDGAGTLHVGWDNGASLGLLPGQDVFEEVST